MRRRQKLSSKRSLALRLNSRTRILLASLHRPLPRYRPLRLSTSTTPPFSGTGSGAAVISSAYTQGWPFRMAASALGVTAQVG